MSKNKELMLQNHHDAVVLSERIWHFDGLIETSMLKAFLEPRIIYFAKSVSVVGAVKCNCF